VTFDDVRKMSRAWPEVEDGTSCGTPALKVRKKLLVRLREDGDSMVMPGVPPDERDMLVESQPQVFYFTNHYRDHPMVLIRCRRRGAPRSSRCCAGNGGRWPRKQRSKRLMPNRRNRVGKATGSRACAPDDKLRVPPIQRKTPDNS